MAGSFEGLQVWQKAHAFVLEVYKVTTRFPRTDDTCISRASCGELEYLLLLAKDLEFISDADFQRLNADIRTIGKMLNGLVKSLDAHRPLAPTAGGRGLAAGGKPTRRMNIGEKQDN
ncbi:MAG: hypothetical protein DDT38_01287 [Firmicutes bacterium]|nr:hypothetical protein [candidate division NPL-UPA2 bacterium]